MGLSRYFLKYKPNDSINIVKGVGDKTEDSLNKAEIYTVAELDNKLSNDITLHELASISGIGINQLKKIKKEIIYKNVVSKIIFVISVLSVITGSISIILATKVKKNTFHTFSKIGCAINIIESDTLLPVFWEVNLDSKLKSNGKTVSVLTIEGKTDEYTGYRYFPKIVPEYILLPQITKSTNIKSIELVIKIVESINQREGDWVTRKDVSEHEIPIKSKLITYDNNLDLNYGNKGLYLPGVHKLIKIDNRKLNKIKINQNMRLFFIARIYTENDGLPKFIDRLSMGVIDYRTELYIHEYKMSEIKQKTFGKMIMPENSYIILTKNPEREISNYHCIIRWTSNLKGNFSIPENKVNDKYYYEESRTGKISSFFTYNLQEQDWLSYLVSIMGFPIFAYGISPVKRLIKRRFIQ
jgi:hypothetical protein